MSPPPVVIFGASRGTGLELARALRARDAPVIALLRGETGRVELERMGVELVRGDAMDPAALEATLALAPSGYRIVSTLAGLAPDGRWVDEVGNVALVDAALTRPPERFVLVTSMGCGEMASYRSEAAVAAFGTVVDAKTRAEDHLRRSGLPYCILRPGGLRSQPATGRGILSADHAIHGFIHRADLAVLIERVLRDPSILGEALAAVDAELAHGPNPVQAVALVP